jgi:hypothetical protein|tara:strand:- start:169 stop:432 length:264 start_codon:yes stop_codon:yes gene_type:complete
MWDAEFKKVIKDLLNLADQTQADIDFIDNVDSVADLQKAGLILEEIEEHIEALSHYITANKIVRDKLEQLSKKIVDKHLGKSGITFH